MTTHLRLIRSCDRRARQFSRQHVDVISDLPWNEIRLSKNARPRLEAASAKQSNTSVRHKSSWTFKPTPQLIISHRLQSISNRCSYRARLLRTHCAKHSGQIIDLLIDRASRRKYVCCFQPSINGEHSQNLTGNWHGPFYSNSIRAFE